MYSNKVEAHNFTFMMFEFLVGCCTTDTFEDLSSCFYTGVARWLAGQLFSYFQMMHDEAYIFAHVGL